MDMRSETNAQNKPMRRLTLNRVRWTMSCSTQEWLCSGLDRHQVSSVVLSFSAIATKQLLFVSVTDAIKKIVIKKAAIQQRKICFYILMLIILQ